MLHCCLRLRSVLHCFLCLLTLMYRRGCRKVADFAAAKAKPLNLGRGRGRGRGRGGQGRGGSAGESSDAVAGPAAAAAPLQAGFLHAAGFQHRCESLFSSLASLAHCRSWRWCCWRCGRRAIARRGSASNVLLIGMLQALCWPHERTLRAGAVYVVLCSRLCCAAVDGRRRRITATPLKDHASWSRAPSVQ